MVEQEDQVWVVRDKVTKKHWISSSGKGSWNKSGYAKNAWNCKQTNWREPLTSKFDHQDKYEVIDLMKEIRDLYQVLEDCPDVDIDYCLEQLKLKEEL
jgi:hypothetical protein